MKLFVKFLASVILAVPVAVTSLASTTSASTYSVCASGCDFTSIQSAVDGASSGDVISVGPGSYAENVIVPTSVTITGSGSQTIVFPASNGPTCQVSPGGTLCDGSSTVFLVRADDVTIQNLTIEGSNPSLSGGVTVGGVAINARNGIVDDYNSGVYNGLTVTNVTVRDIYHRGIYEASGGTGFNFSDNYVNNVQGSPESIGIFNFGGAGTIAGNTVISANDAISANWSQGTVFRDNTILNSGSGIHTDNSGWSGSNDVISGNTIVDCATDGYGIFTFADFSGVTVTGNNVHGCYVGLADYGSQVPGASTAFIGNVVSGKGATTTDPTGTYGAYVTTDLLGYGFGDANATFANNSITDFGTGLFVTETSSTHASQLAGQATVLATNNDITRNAVGAFGDVDTVVTATSVWWGCTSGPGTKNCDSAGGTVVFSPWMTHAVGRRA